MVRRTFLRRGLSALPLLALPLSSFKTWFSDGKAVVVRQGQSRFGVATPFRKVNPNNLVLSTRDTGGQLSAFWYDGFEQAGPSFHSHLEQDEMFYVISGRYLFKVGEQHQELAEGDLIFLPRKIPHTWIQLSERGQLFYLLQPAGKMEEFFLRLTELDGKGTPQEYEEMGKMAAIQNFGPPLKREETPALSAALSNGFVVRAAKSRIGERFVTDGVSVADVKVSAADTGGTLSLLEYHGKVAGGPPLHVHPEQDEVFFVLEGQYRFRCGDEVHELGVGDFIFLPRNVPHTFNQLSEQGRMLFGFQPAGQMEGFFRALSGIKGAPGPKKAARLFEKHGMRLV
jgi:quercetin 2,3-dioxygenase